MPANLLVFIHGFDNTSRRDHAAAFDRDGWPPPGSPRRTQRLSRSVGHTKGQIVEFPILRVTIVRPDMARNSGSTRDHLADLQPILLAARAIDPAPLS